MGTPSSSYTCRRAVYYRAVRPFPLEPTDVTIMMDNKALLTSADEAWISGVSNAAGIYWDYWATTAEGPNSFNLGMVGIRARTC